MPKLVHMRARRPAGDPCGSCLALTGVAGGRLGSDLSVKSHGAFQRYEGSLVANVLGKSFVELPRFRLKAANLHLNSRSAQLGKAPAGYHWIGIPHGADNAADASCDHGIGARSGAALMRAGLKIEVEGAATRTFSGTFYSENLGVLLSLVGVKGFSYKRSIRSHDDRADARIGRRQSDAGACQFKGAAEEEVVIIGRAVERHSDSFLKQKQVPPLR